MTLVVCQTLMYCPTEISHTGNSGRFFPRGKPAATGPRYPSCNACWVFFSVSLIHRTPTWTIGSLTCAKTLMHAIAHGGCTDTVRESALKADSGRKIPCLTRELHLRRLRAGPMLYQLSYIPILIPVSVLSLPLPLLGLFSPPPQPFPFQDSAVFLSSPQCSVR